MKIPKELSGKEVQKFEDIRIISKNVLCDCGCDYEAVDINPYLNIRIFYAQPFQPSMVEEYFECDSKYNNPNEDVVFLFQNNFVTVKVIQEIRIDIGALSLRNCANHIIIKTLSDFIDACLNSDINLRWKK